jgi:flagellar biosynthesis/type III secretory pathway M-ring protein FliF/YscJ
MAFLNRIFAQIKAQLGGLNLSQKMVIALLLVIMVGAIWVMVNYSAQRERVPLLGQSLSQEEIGRISQILDQDAEEHTVSGDRILVYRNRQRAILAKLSLAEALPQDTSDGWDLILNDSDMMLPDSARKDRNNVVKQKALATIIVELPSVNGAHVIIDKGRRFSAISSASPSATASAMLTTNGTYSKRKLADAAAFLISGSVGPLKPQNVNVVIDGKHIPVLAKDDMGDTEYLSVKKEYEDLHREKITKVMPPGSIVQVDVKWNNTKQTVSKRQYGEDLSWNPGVEATSLTDTSNVSEKQEEPGFVANGSDQGVGSGNLQKQETDEASETSKPFPGYVETNEQRGQGGVKEVTATVLIPDSYFTEMAKGGKEEEPDQAAVDAMIAQELPALKKAVMGAIGFSKGEGEDRVVVGKYPASIVAVTDAMVPTENAGAVGTITNMAMQHTGEIAVAALALISILGVLMMVRKTVGPVDLSDEEAAAMLDNPPLDAQGFEDSQFADGEGGDALLSGLELDDENIRSQQVLQQIREMISESPDSATELVSKWINQDH